MHVSSVPVHRVIATTFHGEPPSKAHVVDHIDTNRRNNRPENLRWVTRLENILLNPISAKRIALAYGSIEEFFVDPSKPRLGPLKVNFEWMRTVTPQEAEASYQRLLAWAASENGSTGGSLGDWLYRRGQNQQEVVPEQTPLVKAKTPGAFQRNWKVPSEFPNCPIEAPGDALAVYAGRLQEGAVFAQNYFGASTVTSVALELTRDAILVLGDHGEDAIKQWSLARVELEDGSFVHESLGTFFSREGAEKQFCLAQGLPWDGGDSIDDYC